MTFRVGPKGQVVIPKALRDRLGIQPGDEVTFSLADGGVLVEPVRDRPSLKGRYAGAGMLAALERDHLTDVAKSR
jgi:AbrB family looped-hinge helix DNA binding protein